MERRSPIVRFLDRAERLLETYAARVVLSTLIIISVLPYDELVGVVGEQVRLPGMGTLDSLFLVIFGAEFLLRFATYIVRRRQERTSRWEPLLLALDFVAVVSFLPIERVMQLRWARLIRLSRIILLLGYWGDMVRDLWSIVTSRERRFQIAFVMFSGLTLSFAAAVVVWWLQEDPKAVDERRSFLAVLWDSFRQVQDPGNLVAEPRPLLTVVVSLILTFAGLLLFSFLIGIGTTAIEELMKRSRMQPVGLRNHTVILGLGEHSRFLLEEFAEIYRKNRRVLRSAVLGPTDLPPDSMTDLLDAFSYRHGDPVRADDLSRVDVERAKRVLVLGTDPGDPDSSVIASILATRDRNPDVELFPDLEHESSLAAARTAGGPRTHVVGSGSFVGNYIAQNVANPGIYRLYRQLLTSAGCEIYSYVFDADEHARFVARHGDGAFDGSAIHARAFETHGVTLVGYFVALPDSREHAVDGLDIVLCPVGRTAPPEVCVADRLDVRAVRGVVGVSLRWEDVRSLAQAMIADRCPSEPLRPASQSFDELTLERTGRGVKRVVILGDSRRIPRVVADLVAFYGSLAVRLFVREPDRLSILARDLASALRRTCGDVAVEREDHAAGDVSLAVDTARGRADVRFSVGDWSDATRLVDDPDVSLATTDVLLLLPRTRGADALDGQVALDCLQLAQADVDGRMSHPARFRVLAMIQDPVKGDLLERRLDEMSHAPDERFTIVSSERVRHHFIVQNVFVRGLNAVYFRLFEPGGPSICRVTPHGPGGGPPTGTFQAFDLARHLVIESRCVLLGLELADGDGDPETLLDPRALRESGPIEWSRVRALYVLGELNDSAA